MRNLYFQRSDGTYLLIKENIVDEQEGLDEVSAFLKGIIILHTTLVFGHTAMKQHMM